ncbi:MAG TPA: redox-regulated ATPase YchF [Terrimicrobiaceae bacterium]|nr:redox-regulated ATPase YchF [Terrimicrobiaceae bacterium]
MLKAGIVGLPNVGKSTLFNAVTRTRKAQAANFPFCTIEPNVGIVNVPDVRLERLAALSGSEKIIPTAIEFVDIAGLVQGASEGEGLGNQFLSHIREVDAIVQVVRCFESEDIHHVAGSVDPVRDIEVITTELILADMSGLKKRAERLQKGARSGDKTAKAEIALAEKILPHLDSGRPALTADLSDEEKKLLKEFFLLTSKPVIFACNVGENDLAQADNPHIRAVREYAAAHMGSEAVVISAQIESELAELPPEDAREFLAGLGVEDSGVSQLIRAVYHLLGLRTYLTTGPKETRAWTIRIGDKAPAAAGVIHSDFERGFIAAQTIAFEDLITYGSEAKAREAGKLRVEGKDYVVQDGDVMEFRFNV